MSDLGDTTLEAPRVARDRVHFRNARPEDGPLLHRLVEDGGVLELNTGYCYVLLCDHFRATTVIAELDGAPVGFVAAYRPPTRPDAVFVWQIGVHPRARGRGVARRLLEALIARPACRDVRALEATVTPDNTASRRLFESFARHRRAPFEWSEGYPGALFGDAHASEELIRVGPFPAPTRALS